VYAAIWQHCAKHKSGPIKISGTGRIAAELLADFSKNGRKGADFLAACSSHKALEYLQN
jgi:hypothetical protein